MSFGTLEREEPRSPGSWRNDGLLEGGTWDFTEPDCWRGRDYPDFGTEELRVSLPACWWGGPGCHRDVTLHRKLQGVGAHPHRGSQRAQQGGGGLVRAVLLASAAVREGTGKNTGLPVSLAAGSVAQLAYLLLAETFVSSGKCLEPAVPRCRQFPSWALSPHLIALLSPFPLPQPAPGRASLHSLSPYLFLVLTLIQTPLFHLDPFNNAPNCVLSLTPTFISTGSREARPLHSQFSFHSKITPKL